MKLILEKKLYLLSILMIFTHFSYGQILRNVNLDLNLGGAIYDVAYDSYLDAYIVVGDFSTINGQPRKNLAVINVDMTLSNKVLINDIDGPIRTVEVHKKESIFICPPLLPCQYVAGRYSVFIGGKFTAINGNQRINVARLSFSFYNTPNAGDNYSLSSWDAEIESGDPYYNQVNDIAINGDTMVMVGQFFIEDPSYEPLLGIRSSVMAYNVANNSPQYLNLFTNGVGAGLVPIFNEWSLNQFNLVIFLDGIYYFSWTDGSNSGGFFRYKISDGSYSLFTNSSCSSNLRVVDFCLSSYGGLSPSFYLFERKCGASYPSTSTYDLNGNTVCNHPPIGTMGATLYFFDSYKNKIYDVRPQPSAVSKIRVFKRNIDSLLLNKEISFQHTASGQSGAFFNWFGTNYTGWQPKKLIVEQNKLFFTGNHITQVDGKPRKGLAVFCLEPHDALPFTLADTTICNGNIRTYSIPKVKFATGYKWTYTGNGAEIGVLGQSGVRQPLLNGVPLYLSDKDANSIKIEFLPGTTGGTLTVAPFSICNDTEYQTSKGQSIELVEAPLPSLLMVADTMAFTCLNRDSLNLDMTSPTADYFFWKKGTNTDTLNENSLFTIYNTDSVSDSSFNSNITYYGYAKEPINGCTAMDSVFVKYDTLALIIDELDLHSNPSVFNCETTQMEFTSTIPGATVEWGLTNSTVFANDSFTIYSKDTSTFYAHATYTNGCKSVQQHGYVVDETILEGEIANYPINHGVPIDIIDCNQSALNLNVSFQSGQSTTVNNSISWIYNGNYIGNSLTLSASDSVSAQPNPGLSTTSKTYQYVTYSDDSKCTKTVDVTVVFDFEKPYVQSYSNPPTLNCSTDSLQLVHPNLSNTNVSTGWLDAMSINTFSDSLTVNNPSTYLFESILNRNGCKTIDTVQIVQSNELLLNSTNDTTVCIGEVVSLSTSPINYSNTIDYTWSNGDNTSTTSAIGGIDDTLYVTALSSDGCIGLDTVVVSTNDPLFASFNTFSGCLDGSASIVVDTIFGEAGSYSYSLDGQSFVQNGTFTQLEFGNYPVTVQDGMGCTKVFNVEVDNNAQAPNLNFLVPTYNELGDTIVAVNISDFNGFDSLFWDLPGNTEVIEVNDTMLVFSIYDEDWYDIGIVAYQDTCSFRFDKAIYYGPYKPSFESSDDTLGITNLVVYPNPTNGQFTVEVMFGIVQSYSIVVTSSNGQVIPQMSVSGNDDEVVESFSFPLGTATGAYHINIISEHDARNKIIILQ